MVMERTVRGVVCLQRHFLRDSHPLGLVVVDRRYVGIEYVRGWICGFTRAVPHPLRLSGRGQKTNRVSV